MRVNKYSMMRRCVRYPVVPTVGKPIVAYQQLLWSRYVPFGTPATSNYGLSRPWRHRSGTLRTYTTTRHHCRTQSAPTTFGLAFSISPEAARLKFLQWARKDQGLPSFLLRETSIRLSAWFCPVWSFNVNLRYVVTDPDSGKKRLDWKPDLFSVYGTQSVIHLPGVSAYAGYNYRRSLMDPLHNTSLIFLGDKVIPFDAWMLQDMKLTSTGERLAIYPDPWNATKAQALSVVKQTLQSLPGLPDAQVQVQTQVLSSRRVYMPTYAFSYKLMGLEYQAFVSGCDEGAPVSGVSHQVFAVSQTELRQTVQSSFGDTTNIMSSAASFLQNAVRLVGGRQVGALVVIGLQFVGSLVARLLLRIPLIGAIGGALVGFRKIVQPWMDHRVATAEWERQRQHEASVRHLHDHMDDFVDMGSAKRYFDANRETILRHLGGASEHSEGSFEWFVEWEKWAQQQWTQQQQYQQRATNTEQRKGQSQQTRKGTNTDFKWDFDPTDPYSVLDIHRGASSADITAAFRKQMMMHHPDTKSGQSEAEKNRAIERSKIITSAYQVLKSKNKSK